MANAEVSWSMPTFDPTGVGGDVVDAVRDGLGDLRAGEEETVVFDLDRFAGGPPLTAGVGQPVEVLLLLRVDTDDRLSSGLMLLDLLVDVAELGVLVGVLVSFQGLRVACRLNPLSRNSFPTVGADTTCPCRASSPGACHANRVSRGWTMIDRCDQHGGREGHPREQEPARSRH
jgi:hypothetical protein